LVESTGVSEPVAASPAFSSEAYPLINAVRPSRSDSSNRLADATELEPLDSIVRIDRLVTVYDCSTFLSTLKSVEDAKVLLGEEDDDAPASASTEDGGEEFRPLGRLMLDQCQFSNVIILNKADLVEEAQIELIQAVIREVNPAAIIRISSGQPKTDVWAMLDDEEEKKGQFDDDEEEDSRRVPSWAEELDMSHNPNTEAYGIRHYSIQRLARPFHPERWHSVISDSSNFKGVVCGRGCFWVSSQPNDRIDFSLAGRTLTMIKNTVWIEVGIRLMLDPSFQFMNESDFTGKEGGGGQEQAKKDLLRQMTRYAISFQEKGLWDERTHDRRVELMFIGDQTMDTDTIASALEYSFLTDEEFDAFMSGKDFVSCIDPFSSIPSRINLS